NAHQFPRPVRQGDPRGGKDADPANRAVSHTAGWVNRFRGNTGRNRRRKLVRQSGGRSTSIIVSGTSASRTFFHFSVFVKNIPEEDVPDVVVLRFGDSILLFGLFVVLLLIGLLLVGLLLFLLFVGLLLGVFLFLGLLFLGLLFRFRRFDELCPAVNLLEFRQGRLQGRRTRVGDLCLP